MLNIHSTLTNYAEAYQGALTIKKEAEKVAGEKYIGIAYAEEMGKIKDAFHAVIDPLRDTSMKSVQKAIADARTSINSVVSKPMDAELTQTIDIVRKLPNVTLTEKESVLARCEGNYIATRCVLMHWNCKVNTFHRKWMKFCNHWTCLNQQSIHFSMQILMIWMHLTWRALY